jgi:molybdenum cofactor guanylyltransferase
MRLLGAIIAGGKATRFGADKGAALLDGKPLIDHVADGLRRQTDALVICGRAWPGLETVSDRPAPDLGPLGGLCGSLQHAAAHGFDAVLTAGCDVLPIPDSLAERLGNGPACVAGQRLLGVWPSGFAPLLEQHLLSSDDRSIRNWISLCRAREVRFEVAWHNINTTADLDHLTRE